MLLSGVNPTVWTIGYAIPYHTAQFEKIGFGLGLNSMQGREAKHVKLAKYVENTCNVKKSMRWWIVFFVMSLSVSCGLERWTPSVYPTDKRKEMSVNHTFQRG